MKSHKHKPPKKRASKTPKKPFRGSIKMPNKVKPEVAKTESYLDYCLRIAADNSHKEYDVERNCYLVRFNKFGKDIVDLDDIEPDQCFTNCLIYRFDNEDKADAFLNQKRVQLAVWCYTDAEISLDDVKVHYKQTAYCKLEHTETERLPIRTWQQVAIPLITQIAQKAPNSIPIGD